MRRDAPGLSKCTYAQTIFLIFGTEARLGLARRFDVLQGSGKATQPNRPTFFGAQFQSRKLAALVDGYGYRDGKSESPRFVRFPNGDGKFNDRMSEDDRRGDNPAVPEEFPC